jgi:hypothetical protein
MPRQRLPSFSCCMKVALVIKVAIVAILTAGPLSGQAAACVSPLCELAEVGAGGAEDALPAVGAARHPSDPLAPPAYAPSSSGLAPWVLPAVGAAAGATAFTYAYVAGCRKADCVGFHAPYTILVGGVAGAVVGRAADRLIATLRD